MPQKRSQKRGENVQDMARQVLLFVKSQIHQGNKNFYSQSLGNLEVIGVQKTACVADMTSRSYNPEFNNPLEKVVNIFQKIQYCSCQHAQNWTFHTKYPCLFKNPCSI